MGQELKPYVEERPWGKFERFTENKTSTVKIITVNPGQAFSLQHHSNRDEFWRIISGSGTITLGEEKSEISPGKDFFVRAGVNHRIEAGSEPVVFLEISLGEFREDDIVRVEDKYGRI